jgi:4-amino-4-deoxy-L-arabinose transferase-like glycosyltransferase
VKVGHRQARRPRQQERPAAGPAVSSPDFPLRLAIAVVAVALAAGLVLRILDLKADPPRNLSWSSAIYSDEAHNAYSARNWALYGRWQVDDYVPYVVYPWLNLFTGVVLRIAGIGFVQLKIVSLLAGLLFIAAMYFLGRAVSRRAGTIAAVISALSYYFVMYSRLGLAEMTQVLLVAATVAFLARAQNSRVAAMASGACALFAVLFVKVSAVFLPAAALILLITELVRARIKHSRSGAIASQALFWLLGASLPLVVWLVAIFIPHRSTYLSYVFEHSVGAQGGHPANVSGYLLNAFCVGSWSSLYDKLPFLAAVGFATLPAFAGRAGRSAVYSALILVTGVAMLGYGYYHPDRYELFTLVPMIAGFAFAIDRLLEKELRIGHPWPHIVGVLGYGLWLWPLAAQVSFRLAHQRGGTNRALVVALLAALAASFGLWGLHKATRGGIPLRSLLLRGGIAAALVLLVLGRDIKLYTDWYGARTHLMYDCSRDLDRVLPDSSVTGGFWAPAMLATSHKRALFISNQWGANLVDPIKRFGLTHVVVTGGEEFAVLDSILDGRVSAAKVIRMYRINDIVVVGVAQLQP